MKLPGGGAVRTANLTPDAGTGIGTWSEAQFVDTFKAFDGAVHRPLSAAEQRENTGMPWVRLCWNDPRRQPKTFGERS